MDSAKCTDMTDSQIQVLNFRPVSFIPHDPEVWFATLETQFEIRRITNQRLMFAYALESLPGDHIAAVREVVLNPNAPDAYNRLKEAILQHFLPSKEERLRTLLARHPMGDAKPSHHLTRLQSLAGPTAANSDIVKELWLDSLPAHVQPTIAALPEDMPLSQVALVADRVITRTGHRDNYTVASTSHTGVGLEAKQGKAHKDQGCCIHSRLSFSDRSKVPEPYVLRARSRSRKAVSTRPQRASSKPRQRAASEASTGWCWFHRTFRSAARHCRPPCSYKAGNSQAGE
ncbi:unnamed protein product [Schistosoma turkestanicum]|nr:unnamed protein product [Schistosoma turkestanicum]